MQDISFNEARCDTPPSFQGGLMNRCTTRESVGLDVPVFHRTKKCHAMSRIHYAQSGSLLFDYEELPPPSLSYLAALSAIQDLLYCSTCSSVTAHLKYALLL